MFLTCTRCFLPISCPEIQIWSRINLRSYCLFKGDHHIDDFTLISLKRAEICRKKRAFSRPVDPSLTMHDQQVLHLVPRLATGTDLLEQCNHAQGCARHREQLYNTVRRSQQKQITWDVDCFACHRSWFSWGLELFSLVFSDLTSLKQQKVPQTLAWEVYGVHSSVGQTRTSNASKSFVISSSNVSRTKRPRLEV